MKKIRALDEMRINIDSGCAEIHIAEESDTTYNISISEMVDDKIRVGIPDSHGKTFHYWKHIKKIMKQQDKIGQLLVIKRFLKALENVLEPQPIVSHNKHTDICQCMQCQVGRLTPGMIFDALPYEKEKEPENDGQKGNGE